MAQAARLPLLQKAAWFAPGGFFFLVAHNRCTMPNPQQRSHSF
jgi:hypothetical protein